MSAERVVFYQLVTAGGRAYADSDIDFVKCSPEIKLLFFADIVHSRNSSILSSYAVSQLKLYRFTESLNVGHEVALDKKSPLGDSHGNSLDQPLLVVVPNQADLLNKGLLMSQPNYYLYLAPEDEVPPAVAAYHEMADRMQQDSATMRYINALWEGFVKGTNEKVFNALCVPSGTGKTQLAFALPKDKCVCIYFNMGVCERNKEASQPVYGAFVHYMTGIRELLLDDFAHRGKRSEFWVYGFLAALLRIHLEQPDLDLPGALRRVVITADRPGHGVPFEEVRKTVLANVGLKRWKIENSSKKLTFFIDEFTSGKLFSQQQLAYFRRKLMDTGECVIVASTDSGALNMFNADAATEISRDGEHRNKPWVQLCTRLPAYVADHRVKSAVDACPDLQLRAVLKLCLASRPLFAHKVAGKIKTYLENLAQPYSEFFEELRRDMVSVLRTKRRTCEVQGCYGYVTAMLRSGSVLFGNNPHWSVLYGNLSTKSWAYIVNDPELLSKVGQNLCPVSRKDRDDYETISIRGLSPRFMILYRKSLTNSHELHFKTTDGADKPFTCRTFFPDVEEDFLLYLAIAGSSDEPGLYLSTPSSSSDRISVAKLMYLARFKEQDEPQSQNAPTPKDEYHEALVCAAFAFACSAGPLSGFCLKELVTRYVAELMIPTSVNYPELELVDRIEWGGKFRGKFVFPFDAVVSKQVHDVLGSAASSRPMQRMQIDAVVFASDLQSYNVIVEAKSCIDIQGVREKVNDALKCQDSNTRVSFIVLNKKLVTKKGFNTSEFEVLDRSKKIGNINAKGRTLNARIYYVTVERTNESNQRRLRQLDTAPAKSLPDSVVFVISTDEIGGIC